MARTSHLVRMNSVASQSSSSGCDGRVALRAEIFGGLDDAGSEIQLPVAIHGHARGERMRGIDEPFGEVEAGGALAVVDGERRQDGGSTGLDLVGLIAIVAAAQHEGVARLLHLAHDHGGEDLFLQRRGLFAEGFQVGVLVAQRLVGDEAKIVFAQAGFFGLGELSADAGENGLDRILDRDVLDFLRRQGAVVEARDRRCAPLKAAGVRLFDADEQLGVRTRIGRGQSVSLTISLSAGLPST